LTVQRYEPLHSQCDRNQYTGGCNWPAGQGPVSPVGRLLMLPPPMIAADELSGFYGASTNRPQPPDDRVKGPRDLAFVSGRASRRAASSSDLTSTSSSPYRRGSTATAGATAPSRSVEQQPPPGGPAAEPPARGRRVHISSIKCRL